MRLPTFLVSLVLLSGCDMDSGADEVGRSQRAAMHASADIRVMTYNIKNSFGDVVSSESGKPWCVKCETNSLIEIADNISAQDPDIVALQEIGTRMRDAEYEDQLRSLSEYTGLPYYYQLNYKDLENQESVPIWLDSHGPGGINGVGILSRWAFVGHPEELRLVRDPDTVNLTGYEASNLEPAALRVTVLAPLSDGDTLIDVYSVHLYDEAPLRREQAHLIDRWARPDRPALLMGDLNSEPVDLDTVLDYGWSNPLASELISYPAWTPNLPKVRRQIDYVLTRNFSTATAHDAFESGGSALNALPIASDHMAITYDLELASCPKFNTNAPSLGQCSAGSLCRLCRLGEGDCDFDSDCAEGLVCAFNTGPAWGLPATYDVCEVPGAATPIPGSFASLSSGVAGPASTYASNQSFSVSVASDTTFDVQVKYSTTEERQASIVVDGRRMARMTLLEDTGDWGGAGLWEHAYFHHIPLKAGDHVIALDLGGDGVNLKRVEFVEALPGPWEELAFPISEGILQAEKFDIGGHSGQTPGNQGGVFRTGDVDVYKDGQRLKVRWTAGEEIQYTLTTPVARTLDLELQYKSNTQSTVHIELDGVDVTGAMNLANSNGSWGHRLLHDIAFPAGTYTMRVVIDSGAGSFDFFRFKQISDAGPLAGEPFAVGSRIEAEYYDLGGALDNSPGNNGEMYRWDGVDLWDDRTGHAPSGAYLVYGTEAGEWLEYTFEAEVAGTYEVDLRYATPLAGRTVSLNVDGVPVVSSMPLPLTLGWGKIIPPAMPTWDIATSTGFFVDEGTHTLRVLFDNGLVNLDYLEIQP